MVFTKLILYLSLCSLFQGNAVGQMSSPGHLAEGAGGELERSLFAELGLGGSGI